MLMGVNVISTDTPSMRTLIPNDNYGFLLPMYDYDGIVNRINELRDNPAFRDSQRVKALERMDLFSSENVAKQLGDAIEACYGK
jgi:glycosyltransferase involved in cell wall biosynthesis